MLSGSTIMNNELLFAANVLRCCLRRPGSINKKMGQAQHLGIPEPLLEHLQLFTYFCKQPGYPTNPWKKAVRTHNSAKGQVSWRIRTWHLPAIEHSNLVTLSNVTPASTAINTASETLQAKVAKSLFEGMST